MCHLHVDIIILYAGQRAKLSSSIQCVGKGFIMLLPVKAFGLITASRFFKLKLTRFCLKTFMFFGNFYYLPFKDLFYELECFHMYVFIILSFIYRYTMYTFFAAKILLQHLPLRSETCIHII